MNVLHLVGLREDCGGVLSVLRDLHIAMQPQGVRHFVWVNQDFRERRRPALEYRYNPYICSDLANHWLLLWRSIRALPGARRLVRQESFDIIHAHTRAALLVGLGLAQGMHRSVLFTNHNYARRTGFYRWAARRRRIQTVLLTPNMARHYQLAAPAPRVTVISASAGMDFFTAPVVERRRMAEGGPLRFAGLGNVVRWKNWHLALRALAALDPEEKQRVRFDHWGPTPSEPDCRRYEEELRQFAAHHGMAEQVAFHGATNAAAECLKTADWFLLPSSNEPCSVALIEALALGIPALVSASGGNVDIIAPSQNGLLFQPEDETSLAAQFRLILQGRVFLPDPARIRESVRFRSAACVAGQYYALYRHMLDRAPEVGGDGD